MKRRYWFSERYWVQEAEEAGERWRPATEADWQQAEQDDPEAVQSWRRELTAHEALGTRPDRLPRLWVRIG
jgi:hypothetical protein